MRETLTNLKRLYIWYHFKYKTAVFLMLFVFACRWSRSAAIAADMAEERQILGTEALLPEWPKEISKIEFVIERGKKYETQTIAHLVSGFQIKYVRDIDNDVFCARSIALAWDNWSEWMDFGLNGRINTVYYPYGIDGVPKDGLFLKYGDEWIPARMQHAKIADGKEKRRQLMNEAGSIDAYYYMALSDAGAEIENGRVLRLNKKTAGFEERVDEQYTDEHRPQHNRRANAAEAEFKWVVRGEGRDAGDGMLEVAASAKKIPGQSEGVYILELTVQPFRDRFIWIYDSINNAYWCFAWRLGVSENGPHKANGGETWHAVRDNKRIDFYASAQEQKTWLSAIPGKWVNSTQAEILSEIQNNILKDLLKSEFLDHG